MAVGRVCPGHCVGDYVRRAASVLTNSVWAHEAVQVIAGHFPPLVTVLQPKCWGSGRGSGAGRGSAAAAGLGRCEVRLGLLTRRLTPERMHSKSVLELTSAIIKPRIRHGHIPSQPLKPVTTPFRLTN